MVVAVYLGTALNLYLVYRVSIDLSVGCPANGLGVGAINVGANGLAGNASDECLQNDDFNPSGLGATLMSVGGTTNNALANNDSGYTLVRTGFVETNGTFGGGQNANIWVLTMCGVSVAEILKIVSRNTFF